MKGLCRDPGPHERAGHLVPGRAGDQAALDCQHDDPVGLLEQRAGKGDRARRLGAGVPGDHDRPANLRGRCGWSHEDRAAAVEQKGFQHSHARRGGAAGWLAHDRQVEQPGMLADEFVTRRRLGPEGCPRTARLGPGSTGI